MPREPILLAHVLLAANILAAFAVLSVAAGQLLRPAPTPRARPPFAVALAVAVAASVAQLAVGGFVVAHVADVRPAALAAFEGQYHTGVGDFHVVGWPDDARQEVRWAVTWPGGLGFFLYG